MQNGLDQHNFSMSVAIRGLFGKQEETEDGGSAGILRLRGLLLAKF